MKGRGCSYFCLSVELIGFILIVTIFTFLIGYPYALAIMLGTLASYYLELRAREEVVESGS